MLEKILISPIHAKRLIDIRKKVYTKVGTLSIEGCMSEEPIPLSERDMQKFKPMKKGKKWAEKFGCCWFRMKGNIPVSCAGKHIVALVNINGEGAVYKDGKVLQGITQVLSVMDAGQIAMGKQVIELAKEAKGGEDVEFFIDAGHNGINGMFITCAKIKKADIAYVNDTVHDYYYDYLALLLLTFTYGKNKSLTKEMKEATEKLLNVSYSLFKQDKIYAARQELAAAYQGIKNDGTIFTAIGHAHLDLAWLWPIRETRRKAVRTFSTALSNMEKYPYYIFGASQAQLFEWIKQDQNELYERVKKAVMSGRIEIQGNMWTECDCNITGGESLIRQFMYGDKFFINEMGANSKMVWLPDVFGFPATLPQIIKGVGKDYFMTIKLSWNEHNKFPLNSFLWESPDGSKVVAHIAPEGTYNSHMGPIAVTKANLKNLNEETGRALMIYGVGDGGGGPGEGHLELLNRTSKMYGINKVNPGKAEEFFKELEKCELKTHKGELYLEKHQGTLTSQSDNKLYNRLLERELHNIEWLLACTDKKYCLDDIWKEVLLYQFHDIIPGSSIRRVHKESVQGYKKMYNKLLDMRSEILNSLPSKENGLTALNATSFARSENIKYKNKWYKALCEPYSSCILNEVKQGENNIDNDFIENEFIKLTIDNNGVIKSMFDKKRKMELSADGLNKLVVYKDKKKYYNAWDIDINYVDKKPERPYLLARKTYTDGPCAVMELDYAYNQSTINQKILLVEDGVTFETKVNWNEKHKMLRAEFYPSIYSEKVNCDIQFGSVDRSTKNITSVEKAQFEICAHKYVAVSNEKGIFALINDCKYGHRVKDGLISLNLLRSPKHPDKECDMGPHSFGYRIVVGENMEDIVKEAYIFNNPLIIYDKAIDIYALIKADNKNIIVESIKMAEDDKGIVVRMYERYGRHENITVMPMFEHGKIYECNLLEEERVLSDGKLKFEPYKIKTLYIEKL